MENYVGKLFEKCAKAKLPSPNFTEIESTLGGRFKATCELEEWRVTGEGSSKRLAKHHAAQLMTEKLEAEKVFENKLANINVKSSAICRINEYCLNNKKDFPQYAEQDKEGDNFVCQCVFDGFTAVGKGKSKKIAKENAATEVAEKFSISKYFDELNKSIDEKNSNKNVLMALHERCQKIKNVMVNFTSQQDESGYWVRCTVGEYITNSMKCISKKGAKIDAAQKMLALLDEKNNYMNTPTASPKKCEDAGLIPQNITPQLTTPQLITPQLTTPQLKQTPDNSQTIPASQHCSSSSNNISVKKEEQRTFSLKRPFPNFLSDDSDDD